MQEALGADFTDLNWSAQPSSDDLAMDHGPHSFPCISFTPLIQAIPRCADAPDGMSLARRFRAPLSRGYLHRVAKIHGLDTGIDPAFDGERAISVEQRDNGSGAAGELFRGPRCRVPDRQCAGLWLLKYDI